MYLEKISGIRIGGGKSVRKEKGHIAEEAFWEKGHI
jgi:hypothetical protein